MRHPSHRRAGADDREPVGGELGCRHARHPPPSMSAITTTIAPAREGLGEGAPSPPAAPVTRTVRGAAPVGDVVASVIGAGLSPGS